jgi:3D (Asp-Asp-Asp) domain-containing protein
MKKLWIKINKFYKKTGFKYSQTVLATVFALSLFIHSSVLAISQNPETGKPVNQIEVEITAYSSTKNQTDSTPFLSASGKHVYDGMIAANFLPFGTKIKIPELFGDKIFIVDDRMNKRYQNRIDIWHSNNTSAINFGIKKTIIEIVS